MTITNGATTEGDVTVTLDGQPVTVTLASTDNTPDLVATKIAAGTFNGWDAVKGSKKVTFTKKVSGVCQTPTYSPGETGAEGTIKVTTAGTADSLVDA